ncbi:MAG: glycosyltransferase family 2 protein [Candidatus Hydrogenedentes bacterium]|nr:glycosyltransferase family 2 protein [Candidatus Hydrogenedentota bacterium]
MITNGIVILLILAALGCLACALYLIILLGAALVGGTGKATKIAAELKLVVVIPAHDEEKLLARTIGSIQCCDYPSELREVVVVADNCTDRTADVARACGATVLERTDASRRGKGHALDYFIGQYLASHELVNAVIVIDADNVVTPNLLAAVSQRVVEGCVAGQVRDAADNAEEGWRPSMQYISLALKNHVRALGRQALGCSGGLFGNGMFFSRDLLLGRGWPATSIVEDVEFASRLIMEGVKIAYAPEASVSTSMPVSSAAAEAQKSRWEAGQFRMARSCGIPLLRHAVLTLSLDALLWGIDLMIPPLMMLFAFAGLVLAVSVVGLALSSSSLMIALASVSGAASVLLVVYAIGGLWCSRAPKCVWFSLLKLPAYGLWKAGLYLGMAVNGAPKEWVRTGR